MVKLLPTVIDGLAESTTQITSGFYRNVPFVGNGVLCADCVYAAGRPTINFYCSPNPVAKAFFGASSICGVIGAVSSGTALMTSFAGIPVAGWTATLAGRTFNSLGKYTLHMGNVTNGNITNVTAISELMY